MTEQVVPTYIRYNLRVLPEWSPCWCATPGCEHMVPMGDDYCPCCEDGAP